MYYFIFKLNIYLEYEKKWQQITRVLKLKDKKKKNLEGMSPFPTLPCTEAGYCTSHPLKRFKLEHKNLLQFEELTREDVIAKILQI